MLPNPGRLRRAFSFAFFLFFLFAKQTNFFALFSGKDEATAAAADPELRAAFALRGWLSPASKPGLRRASSLLPKPPAPPPPLQIPEPPADPRFLLLKSR